jgi:electron transfer flavoprotein beta subunit
MNVIVCVKQVPEAEDVKVDPLTGILVRQSTNTMLNPYCESALDHAVRLKSGYPDINIIAVSMGPTMAETALMRCLELGADQGILVSDSKFAGSDTLATALILAAVIRKFIPDHQLILVGKQSIDGDTGQVGPAIAEILNLPQILFGIEMSLTSDRKYVCVKRESKAGFEVLEAKMPALVSASKGEKVRRMPTVADFLKARHKAIIRIAASDLDVNDAEVGLSGSYTQVIKMFSPDAKRGGRRIEGLEPNSAAKEITLFLKAEGYI